MSVSFEQLTTLDSDNSSRDIRQLWTANCTGSKSKHIKGPRRTLFVIADCVFVLINSVLLDLLCVWILFWNASSHSCFNFLRWIQILEQQCRSVLSIWTALDSDITSRVVYQFWTARVHWIQTLRAGMSVSFEQLECIVFRHYEQHCLSVLSRRPQRVETIAARTKVKNAVVFKPKNAVSFFFVCVRIVSISDSENEARRRDYGKKAPRHSRCSFVVWRTA